MGLFRWDLFAWLTLITTFPSFAVFFITKLFITLSLSLLLIFYAFKMLIHFNNSRQVKLKQLSIFSQAQKKFYNRSEGPSPNNFNSKKIRLRSVIVLWKKICRNNLLIKLYLFQQRGSINDVTLSSR